MRAFECQITAEQNSVWALFSSQKAFSLIYHSRGQKVCRRSYSQDLNHRVSSPFSVCHVKLTVPAALAGFEVRATASPPGYIGSSPSRTRTLRQSRCVCPAALGLAPPGRPTAGRGPSAGQPARGEPAGTAHTWRRGWRGLKGRSSGPQKRWQTCPYGCARADAVAPLP